MTNDSVEQPVLIEKMQRHPTFIKTHPDLEFLSNRVFAIDCHYLPRSFCFAQEYGFLNGEFEEVTDH